MACKASSFRAVANHNTSGAALALGADFLPSTQTRPLRSGKRDLGPTIARGPQRALPERLSFPMLPCRSAKQCGFRPKTPFPARWAGGKTGRFKGKLLSPRGRFCRSVACAKQKGRSGRGRYGLVTHCACGYNILLRVCRAPRHAAWGASPAGTRVVEGGGKGKSAFCLVTFPLHREAQWDPARDLIS